MKKIILSTLIVVSLSAKAQLFNQQFTTDMATVTNAVAITDPTYIGDPPSNSQFTYLFSTGQSSNTTTVSGGALQIVTGGSGSIWAAVRNANFAVTPTAMQVKMKAKVDVGSSGSNRKWFFYVGSSFTNSTAAEANAQVHSGFSIRYANSAYYFVKTLADGGGTGVTDQVADNTDIIFTFVTNNSGGSISYTAPDNSTETLADDSWDLWLGTTKKFDDQAATTTSQSLNQFKFGDNVNSSAGRANWTIDYLEMTDLTPALPVNFGAFTAKPTTTGVNLQFTTLTESQMSGFEVEYSLDGRSFTTLANLPAQNRGTVASTYHYQHTILPSSTAYYRIKGIGVDGKLTYSAIVKMNSRSGKETITVSPNPVKDYRLNLQLGNIEKGTYSLAVFNSAGVMVHRQTLTHLGGNAALAIGLPTTLQKGNYSVQLTGNLVKLSQQFLLVN